MSTKRIIVPVTFSLDTNAYASGDLLADTQPIADSVPGNSGFATIDSITLLDFDAQAQSVDLIFLGGNISMGTENSAPNISDANLSAYMIGVISLLTTDYKTISGASVATLRSLALPIKSGPSGSAAFIALMCRSGTPTYTAAGLKALIGITSQS